MAPDLTQYPAHQSSRPYTRWWWLGGPFRQEDIVYQLDWLNANGFGGVELAWLDPTWQGRHGRPRPGRTGSVAEWSELVGFTKRYADEIGLGCDLTFGSCWPFGGSVVSPDDALQTLTGLSTQRLYGSWETGPRLVAEPPLGGGAAPLRRGAGAGVPAGAGRIAVRAGLRLAGAGPGRHLEPGAVGRVRGALRLSPGGARRAGPHAGSDALRVPPDGRQRDAAGVLRDVRADLPRSRRRLAGPVPRRRRRTCWRRTPAWTCRSPRRCCSSRASRGSRPRRRRWPARRSCQRRDVHCIYGIVGLGDLRAARYWRREQVADLKLLADAVFANGVNQVVWHGMPFNGAGRQARVLRLGPRRP